MPIGWRFVIFILLVYIGFKFHIKSLHTGSRSNRSWILFISYLKLCLHISHIFIIMQSESAKESPEAKTQKSWVWDSSQLRRGISGRNNLQKKLNNIEEIA